MYIWFQANNDTAYLLATTAKPFGGERCSWSLQETRTWETWFASTNIYGAPTICKALWNPKLHLFPHYYKKRKASEEHELILLRKTLYSKYMASLATEKRTPFASTLSGWTTSNLSVSEKEAVMEILRIDHLMQLTTSCKHMNHFLRKI